MNFTMFMSTLLFWLATASAYSSQPLTPVSSQLPPLPSISVTDRRTVFAKSIAALTTTAVTTQPAFAAVEAKSSSLEARSAENALSAPAYGMEAPDIFYPPAFQGGWKAASRTTEIFAPCGFDLFTGGKAGYDNSVRSEIKERNDLEYKARFVAQTGDDGSEYIAADREYNAKEIAKAAMGAYSIIDTRVATPNRYSCLLAPPGGSDDIICVDILALARKAEPRESSSNKFVCSEFVRQIVSPAQRGNPNAPPVPPLSVKEIETISIYEMIGSDRIQCRQRTATYLVPSQTDPIAFKRWQLSQGKPVDVRYYDVTYSRV